MIVLAGCGADGSKDRDAAGGRPTETSPGVQTAPSDDRGPEGEIRAVATAYIRGFSNRNWHVVCQTRVAAERREFAREFGSCEKAFEVILKARPGADEVFENAEARDVRIEGKTAGVDIVQPGQAKPATTLAAVREDGGWRLKDLPDARTP